mmetsp:Transcript_14711/g.44438  ORF Transcript_14711/g.44438 Transcript_14711/m.44438 type:complete len:386 (+) Transcript_14711:217-1374(+)
MLSEEVLARIAERDVARRERLAETAAVRQADLGNDLEVVTERLNSAQQHIVSLIDRSVKEDLDAATDEIRKFHQDVQESAWLLPEHELRQKQAEVEQLQQRLDTAVAAAKPRKTFSFSSKSRVGPAAVHSTMQEMAQRAEAAADRQIREAGPSMPSPRQPDPSAVPLTSDSAVSGQRGKRLEKCGMAMRDADFSVTDLTDCIVLLLSPLSALRLRRLQRCTVVAGPISGAVFLDDLTDCTVILAAHQFRCHTSRQVVAWLDVGSNPIIEDCTDMVFGPLSSQHKKLIADRPIGSAAEQNVHSYAGSSSMPDSAPQFSPTAVTQSSTTIPSVAAQQVTSKWASVQDFNHALGTASHNWRLATDAEMQQELSSLRLDEVRTEVAVCP